MTRKAAGETAPGPGALPPLDAFAPEEPAASKEVDDLPF